jgi:hypothetical protein
MHLVILSAVKVLADLASQQCISVRASSAQLVRMLHSLDVGCISAMLGSLPATRRHVQYSVVVLCTVSRSIATAMLAGFACQVCVLLLSTSSCT